jgi:hypothetical protein
LLPSLSSLVPKVSREVCVCFRLFVCDSRSCDWDIGRVLLRKNFYRLPFTPPSLVANPVLQEVIAKLAEDAYFMRVDNRVTQVPPLRTREADHEATSCSPADNGCNRTRGELPQNPNRTRASAGGPYHGGNSAGGASGSRGAAAHGDAGGGGSGGASSSHGAGRRAGGGGAETKATQTATSLVSHVVAMMPAAELKKFDARSPPRQARTTASPPSLLDFATYFSQKNSSLWGSPSTM